MAFESVAQHAGICLDSTQGHTEITMILTSSAYMTPQGRSDFVHRPTVPHVRAGQRLVGGKCRLIVHGKQHMDVTAVSVVIAFGA